MSEDQSPDEILQRGFAGEVRRHYPTRSDVQDMLKPMSDDLETVSGDLKKHLGYHDGQKVTWTIVVPLICVFVSATAILIAALV